MRLDEIFLLCFFIVTVLACHSKSESKETGKTIIIKQQPIDLTETNSSSFDSINFHLSKRPNHASDMVYRANLYVKNKNLLAAARDIKTALEIDSNFAQAHNVKGQIYYMQNNTRQARDEWIRCVKLDPNNTDCRMKLTEMYVAVKNYDEALEQINAIIGYDKFYAPAFFFKGYIIRDYRRDTNTALQYFQKAIDLDQNYIDALDMMAVILTNRGDTLAPYYFDRILEMHPNRADIYYKLGVYYTNVDEINRSLESYAKALQLNPKDAESFFNMGYLHVKFKQYQKARKYFSQAIRVKNRNYKAYYGRGYTYEVVGDVINARKDYQKALEILPIYKPAKDGLDRINS